MEVTDDCECVCARRDDGMIDEAEVALRHWQLNDRFLAAQTGASRAERRRAVRQCAMIALQERATVRSNAR
jgi:hypothetical protein